MPKWNKKKFYKDASELHNDRNAKVEYSEIKSLKCALYMRDLGQEMNLH